MENHNKITIELPNMAELRMQIAELKELTLMLINMTNQPKETKELYTAGETAKMLSISISHLYHLTQSNAIPFQKPNGKKLYFRKADIDNWLNRNIMKSQQQLEEQASSYIQNRGVK